MDVSRKDREVIRKLADKYAGYAHSKVNFDHISAWRIFNRLGSSQPMIMMDQFPWHELNINDELTLICTDPLLRAFENELRHDIYKWEHLDTDQTLALSFSVPKAINDSGIGIRITENTLAADNNNNIISHQYADQLVTEEQLELLHNPIIEHDCTETQSRVDALKAIIGDIMPVVSRGVQPMYVIWDDLAQLRGVTSILMDFLDRPEFMHNIARKMTDIEVNRLSQFEALNLLELQPQTIHCSGALTDELPATDFDGEHVRGRDCWAMGMGQLFAACSKDLHDEFEITYAREYYQNIGLVYYGCCEPLHNRIDIIRKLPNVRKISISPWADAEIAAENIGQDYIMCFKPNPAFIAVSDIDESTIRDEIKKTLHACRRSKTPCEIILKDVSTVQYQPQRLFQWSRIVREEILR